jgi:hypothetical protein
MKNQNKEIQTSEILFGKLVNGFYESVISTAQNKSKFADMIGILSEVNPSFSARRY